MGVDLKKLYQWFDANRDKIIKDHIGEYVLIHNNSVLGYYKTMIDAVVSAKSKKLPKNTFLAQGCLSREEETVHIHTPYIYFS